MALPGQVCIHGYAISVCFDDAIDRTDADTLGGIRMTLAFDTGRLCDHIGDAIAFTDGFRWAFRYAGTTGNTVFSYFHGHDVYSICEFMHLRYTLRFCLSTDDYLTFSRLCNRS